MLIYLYFLSCLICSALGSGPYTPEDNAAFYPINSLNNPGALFPLGGDIPSARVYHTVTASSDYLLVYGGYASDGSFLGDINVFHIPSQAWSGPIVRKQCCDAEGQDIETIGADVDGNFNVDQELPTLDVGYQGDAPAPRAEHTACVINEEMWLFGGITSMYGYVNDVYTFNPHQVAWKVQDSFQGTSYPPRRAGHSMVCDSANEVFYIFGGRSTLGSADNVGLNDLWSYHIRSKKWTLLTRQANQKHQHAPSVRQHASMLMLNGHLYLFGGIHPATGMVFNDVWVFRLAIQQWELLYARKGGNTNTLDYVNTNTNNGYQFAPPPLYSAHLFPVPASLDPFTSFNTTNFGTVLDKETYVNAGFLVYGGVSGGGVCGARICGATETALGQVYKFSLTENTWTSPHTTTGRVDDSATLNDASAERQSVRSSVWEYARISSDVSVPASSTAQLDRGKYVKTFALEKVVFDASRNLMYEIGGMMARKIDKTAKSENRQESLHISHQQSSALSVADVQYADSVNSADSLSNTGDHAIFLTPASGALPQLLWDKHTGEHLRERVNLPTNAFWDYTDGFNNAQNEEKVVFLRAFRTYTVSPSDIVLVQEKVF